MKRREPSDPARPTHQKAAPGPAWWTLRYDSPTQWYQRAAQEDARMNAVSSNQHVMRKDGDR